ncbi:YsnF/AvaK domain-containing protein [Muricoccus radiodurans]|uniref:YsnF/AvaK domain-containing protein n=1 Tax=Muricoccus radiodurans TaxID=2231721 RepID=UPI003CFB1C40
MQRTITGLFDTRADAEAVAEHLIAHDGIARSQITIHGADSTAMPVTMEKDSGFWATLRELFISDEDRYTYSEGIRRGGYVVSAVVDETQVTHAMDVFEQHGAVDLDAREAEWRKSGWTGYQATSTGTTGSTAAAGMTTATGTTTGASAMGVASTGATMAARDRVEGEEVIPVVEERLSIGKREVEHGRVRVRSYIVETPVNESVTLRDERVHVERRAVDLPLSAAEDAFRERTIEAVEHTEEAVVSKEARVKEELVIRKDVGQRTETVSDTVRRTEVEVDDNRAADARVTGTTTAATTKPAR